MYTKRKQLAVRNIIYSFCSLLGLHQHTSDIIDQTSYKQCIVCFTSIYALNARGSAGDGANQVQANTEAGTLTGGSTNAGSEEVKKGEGGGSDETKKENLANIHALAGNHVSSDGHHETFEEVL